MRQEADKLQKDGIDIIIVLSHAGIDVDFKIAREAGEKVDVIIGSHTHTFMYTGHAPGPDKPSYDYPAVVRHNNGHKVLIVQASAFAKYVGDLTVYFDERGEAIRWAGQPIFLGPDVEPGILPLDLINYYMELMVLFSHLLDKHILDELKPWKELFQNVTSEVVGFTDIFFDQSNCQYMECVMGDVIADAFIHSYRMKTNDTNSAIAFIQAGGVRNSLPIGRTYCINIIND